MPHRKLYAWVRKQSPLQAPAWRWYHSALVLLFALLIVMTFVAGGLLADLGSFNVGGREWLIRLRLAVVGLIVYQLLAVRAVPWWRTVAYSLIASGILMNIARNEWQTFSPLTMSFLLLLVGLLIEVLGVNFRPTLTEQIRDCRADLADCSAALNTLEELNERQGDEITALRAVLRTHGLTPPDMSRQEKR